MLVLLISALAAPFTGLHNQASAAACVAPTVDYGRVTSTASIAGTATHRIWTRMYVPDTTNNSYLLEIDGNTCFTVGGNGVTAGSWVWVAFQNGTQTSRTDMSLAQGSHTIKLIGNKPGVKVDRVVFVSDLTCVPTGYGDNCNVPDDTTAPTTQLTAPASGSTVNGSGVNLTATATDAVEVRKVEFYVNGVLLGSDTTSPYNAAWDSTKSTNGTQQLSVRAYDAAGNVGSYSHPVTVSNGDTQAPTTPTNIGVEAASSSKVKVTWSASSDNVGVTGYHLYRNGVPLADVQGIIYEDNTVSPSTTYSYKLEAYDAAGNRSPLSTSISVMTPAAVVADTQAPSQPQNISAAAVSPSQINLAWTASTDNIQVTAYDIYRSSGGANPQKVGTSSSTSYGDTGLTGLTSYSYYVISRDAAGNQSVQSVTVGATTLGAVITYDISGVVRSARNSSRISGVRVSYITGGITNIFQSNKQGVYR
ncbi:MAG: Ig-like domain-containing protein, partial [Candidatus Saccharimonadales bacterium]